MSTMKKTRNNLQQGIFRLDVGKKHSRRKSVEPGNRQFQKAEETSSLEDFLNILDKHGSGTGWEQPILSWGRRRLPGFLPPSLSMNTPKLV